MVQKEKWVLSELFYNICYTNYLLAIYIKMPNDAKNKLSKM